MRHGGGSDDGLAGTAGQHHHTRAALPETRHRALLVVAQLPAVLAQLDRVRLAVDVTGQVLGRPADLQQRLLEPSPLGRVHHDTVVVKARPEHRRDLLRPDDLGEHRAVDGAQHQPVRRVVLQPQPAVAVHGVGDVDEQRVRNGVAGEPDERVDDLFGVMAGGPGVPQRQRGDPVGVHVLG